MPLNYAQKILLLMMLMSSLFTSIFWLVLFLIGMAKSDPVLFTIMALGVLLVVFQIACAIVLGKRVARKILFEGRLKQRFLKVKEHLSLTERRHQHIHDELIEGLLILDENSSIVFANRSAQKILDLKNNFIDRSIAEAIREPELHELIGQVLEEGRALEKNIAVSGVDQKNLQVKAALLDNGHMIVVMLDTTTTSNLDERHNEFVAHASHELKTPISVILANAELLTDTVSKTSQDYKLLQAIHRQAQRAKNLLDSLLELLRFDAGRSMLAPERIDLYEFIEDVKTSLGHSSSLIVNEIDKPVVVMADRLLLERLALIFIENTQKYAGPEPKLYVKAIRVGDQLSLQFADNGPGIKWHLRERVFERFFRQPEHEKEHTEGFGLGLSQAKAIAQAMGQTIKVEDSSAGGCAITLTLDAS